MSRLFVLVNLILIISCGQQGDPGAWQYECVPMAEFQNLKTGSYIDDYTHTIYSWVFDSEYTGELILNDDNTWELENFNGSWYLYCTSLLLVDQYGGEHWYE